MNLAQYQEPDVIRPVLARHNVAIVGLSGNPLRASNFVGRYLQIRGYNVIPVNPRETTYWARNPMHRYLKSPKRSIPWTYSGNRTPHRPSPKRP